MASFKHGEYAAQIAFLRRSDTFSAAARGGGGSYAGKPRAFVLPAGAEPENLWQGFRDEIARYFRQHGIVWHRARAHLLSSQVCCINFLEAFAHRPAALRAMLQPVLGPIETMLPPEPKEEPSRYVAYEAIGAHNYLNEASPGAPRTKGANFTSADAAVRLRRPDGSVETCLIEWKYTESYGRPRPDDRRHPTRRQRYAPIAFAPDGPVRADRGLKLDDLLTEPIYQLFRQQMLAFQMERAHEENAVRVSVLHVSPAGNVALHENRIAPLQRFDGTIFSVWKSLIAVPERFAAVTTSRLFAALPALVAGDPTLVGWHRYVTDRYAGALAPAGVT